MRYDLLREMRESLRHNNAVVLMDSIYSLPMAMEKKEAYFIDHGLWSMETHQILHKIYLNGVKIAFMYNTDVLMAIKDGHIDVSKLTEYNKNEIIKLIGNADTLPYSMDNWVVRHLLWELPFMELKNKYNIFRGINYEREVFQRRGREIYPCLHWSKEDVLEYMNNYDIKISGHEFEVVHVDVDNKAFISSVLAKNKMEDDFNRVKESLKAWGYID